MSRKRGVILFFIIGALITTFTNYFALRIIVPMRFGEYDDDDISLEMTTLKPQISSLLNYRVNKTWGNNGGSLSNEVMAAGAVDDEMILNHPLTVPETLINCTNYAHGAVNSPISGEDSSDKTGNGRSRTFKRASFTIITNLVMANRQVNCGEYITYTTHGDFRYLDNLVPLVERWVGPVSITLYAPAMDLYPTLQRIFYLRECTSPLIKEWVTFHLFSDTRYVIDPAPFLAQMEKSTLNSEICQDIPSFGETVGTIRTQRKLLYPVNVARNVARQEATTHYILASDIELYPSVNLIPDFFELISRNESYFQTNKNPHVFVLPIFEFEIGHDLPETKEQLVGLLKKGVAVPFHKFVCAECHKVPKYEEWIDAGGEDELNVFHVAKRKKPFHIWEPIYIGTNSDPFYDERLSWEGLRDKMSQGYALCVLNYDFMILDNAFLIHRPGIKKKKHNNAKPSRAVKKQNRIIQRKVQKELNKLYGTRQGCVL